MRKIFANYDNEGIYVYQAFKPSIVQAALEKGTFGKGFNLERMTWIKPSFAWMLYRSGYASKHRQEGILKIKLSHHGFISILEQSIETQYKSNVFESENEWRRALKHSEVRHQWDPERDLAGNKLARRAIQIGMRGETVEKYVNEWILHLEEVTSLGKEIGVVVHQGGKNIPSVPLETEYLIAAPLAKKLAITD